MPRGKWNTPGIDGLESSNATGKIPVGNSRSPLNDKIIHTRTDPVADTCIFFRYICDIKAGTCLNTSLWIQATN